LIRHGELADALPVAAKIALVSAGMTAAVAVSPIPPGAAVLLTMWTSTAGISWMRSTR